SPERRGRRRGGVRRGRRLPDPGAAIGPASHARRGCHPCDRPGPRGAVRGHAGAPRPAPGRGPPGRALLREDGRVSLNAYLTLAALVFAIGLFVVLTRRNAIGILLGIELMLNAVNINLVAFARFHGDLRGLVFTLFCWFVWKGDAHVQPWAWIPAGEGPTATVGVRLDPLSNAMLVLVTLVSLLVQIYSLAYLRDERAPSLGRYYTYQSLFAFSMLGLVLSPSFIQMFVFWELVGLCSYLLIGYWYERPSAARAAVKAFWITKLGDLGFVIGIVMLWSATGTFEFPALFALAQEHALAIEGLGTIMLLIYLGAV